MRDLIRAYVKPDNVLRQLRELRRLVPAFEHVQLIRVWSGIEGYTADWQPVMGPSALVPGLHYAFGFNGEGFAIGPGVGETMAELIATGRTSTPIEASRSAASRPSDKTGSLSCVLVTLPAGDGPATSSSRRTPCAASGAHAIRRRCAPERTMYRLRGSPAATPPVGVKVHAPGEDVHHLRVGQLALEAARLALPDAAAVAARRLPARHRCRAGGTAAGVSGTRGRALVSQAPDGGRLVQNGDAHED